MPGALIQSALHRLLRSSSLWAVSDQVCVSAGNFFTSLLLTRILAPHDFGTFVLVNSVFLLLNGFHSNLIVAPLMVIASLHTEKSAGNVFSSAVIFTLFLIPMSGVSLAATCLHLKIFPLFIMALLVLTAWQIQETMRRSLHALQRYRASIAGDSLAYLGQALILGGAACYGRLSIRGVFLIMAISSMVAFFVQVVQVELAVPSPSELYVIFKRFAKIGSWLFVSSLTAVLILPLMPWLLNGFHGREAAAGFQATANVLGMANPLVLSISSVVMPAAARFSAVSTANSTMSLCRMGRRYSTAFLAVLVPWFGVVLIAPHFVLRVFYGSASSYLALTSALRIGVLVYLLTVPLTVFCSILSGSGLTKKNAIMQGVGAVTSLLCAPLLVYFFSISGAMLAAAISLAVRLWVSIRMLIGASQKQIQSDIAEVER